MIGTTAKIVFGLIVGAALLVAVTIALCADLFAPETRPALRRVRSPAKRQTEVRWTEVQVARAQERRSDRPAIRSLMEART